MATEKIIQTRILNKIDTLESWGKSTLKIKQGEICLATVAASAGTGLTEPVVMAKIGTAEEKTFAELPWSFYAKASDVISAAKSEAGLTEFINNIIKSANFADNEAITTLAGRVTAAEGEITTLKGDANTAGSVAKAIKDAIDALDLANTYEAKGEAAKVQTALDNYKTALSDGTITVDKATKDGEGNEITKTYAKASDLNYFAQQVSQHYTNVDTELGKIRDGKEIDSFADVESELESVNNTIGDFSDAGEGATVRSYIDEKVADAKKAGTDAQSDVDALETDVGNVDTLSTTSKTVVGAINEVLAAVGTGGTAAVVTVEKSEDGLTYTIKQGSATVGTIDIPKDMVVTAGEVVTNPEGQAEGTYIKLTLANVTDPLYINVGTLVDIYKAKADATQVQIAIDSATREISATIVAGSIGTTELADNAVTTAKIADANVTKAKLSTEVQASLGKADTALQPENIADLISNKHNHTNKTVLDGIIEDRVNAWDAAEQNAKDYADGKVSALADGQVKTNKEAIEAINNETTGILAQAKADAANKDAVVLAEAQKYADGLAGNYATAEQGGKADTAIQSVTSVADNGIKATTVNNAVTIDWDPNIVFVFDCGTSEE